MPNIKNTDRQKLETLRTILVDVLTHCDHHTAINHLTVALNRVQKTFGCLEGDRFYSGLLGKRDDYES